MNKNSQKNGYPYAFLQDIQHLSATDGWDVVSFISAKAINELWESRWNKEIDPSYKGQKQFIQHISVHSETPWGSVTLGMDVDFKLNAPLLSFIPQAQKNNVNIKIPIIEATVKKYVDGKLVETETYDSQKEPLYLLTQCGLESFEGNVDTAGVVSINIAKGTFIFQGIKLDPIVHETLCKAITDTIKEQGIPDWYLGKIKYQADKEYLKPKKFFFNTYCYDDQKESDLDVLAIYILTTTDKKPPQGMRMSWRDKEHEKAWVVGEEYNTAVYFSSILLWKNEIEPPFIENFGPMTETGTDIPNRIFTNSIPLCNVTVKIKENDGLYIKEIEDNASITLPKSKINLDLELFELKLSCDASWEEDFPYQWYSKKYAPPGEVYHDYHEEKDKLSVSCEFETRIRPSINQDTFEVSFPDIVINPNFTATKPIHDSFFWPKPNGIQDSIVNKAKERANSFFANVKIHLNSMSMFAVSNLLFPDAKMLTPQMVAFPRDLAIIGIAEKNYTPEN